MRILIIGGAGYVGSVLTRSLWELGHDVTVLDLLMFGKEPLRPLVSEPRFRLIEGDLRDEPTLADVVPGHDAVCLLAAIVGEPACNRDEQNAVQTNLEGALKVLEASRRAQVARFVFTSTCSNYGISDPAELATEESPLHPLSVYSRTKVEAEKAILAAAGDGFCPTVLRLSTAFGVSPRMRFDLLVSDFTLAAHRDRKIVIYGEQFWRPFVHVRDVADSVQMVLDAPREVVHGEVFNVGSNRANVQKRELGRMVQSEVAGSDLEFIPGGTDPRSYRVDFTKAAARLGFEPKWTIRRGIQELYGLLQENHWPNPGDKRYYN
ncbi:MAG: NAD(P)-dependent oxidoreductase [Pirellulales bacterium]|nr:NAD(P)-dependent oxidoreductase [Pirellulales bacterium]